MSGLSSSVVRDNKPRPTGEKIRMLDENAPKESSQYNKVHPEFLTRDELREEEGLPKKNRKRVRVTNNPSQEAVINTQNKTSGGRTVLSTLDGKAKETIPIDLFDPIEKGTDRRNNSRNNEEKTRETFSHRRSAVASRVVSASPASFNRETADPDRNQSSYASGHRYPAKKPGTSSAIRREADRTYGVSDGEYNESHGYAGRRAADNSFDRARQPFKKNTKKKKQKLHIQPAAEKVISYPEFNVEKSDPIRLNKYLSNAGLCSRRVADQMIAEGRVAVNGEIVTKLGTTVTRMDRITCDGKEMSIERKVYVLLNKPKNCVTTVSDEQGRTTVMDIVKNACGEKIFPVGRLDRNTTGVLLLTNDGDLAANLLHPSQLKKKIYQVSLDKPVSVEHMKQLAEGIKLEDGEIHADAISYIDEDNLALVGIEIHSGRNRIVRRMFQHLGYHVRSLDRVYFAGLTKKRLPRGHWRYLTETEVINLKMGRFD